MNTNQGAIVLDERAADYCSLRSVMREWGYDETDIQRVLKEQRLSRKLDESVEQTANFLTSS